MDTRSTVAALALAGFVVLAGCTGALGSGDAEQPNEPNAAVQGAADGATIVVGGQGSVEAEPDAATVRLTVAATGDDPETVRDRLSRNVTAVREALTDYGLAEDQIRSHRFRIRENHRNRREPDADHPAFLGEHNLVVELDDVDAVGDVIDAAVESGPVHVDGVVFGLSDERRAELRDRALTQAVEDARSEAELVAAAENLQVGSADRIVTDRVKVDRPEPAVVHEAAATPTAGDSARTRVQSDDVTVTASVQVVYNASDG